MTTPVQILNEAYDKAVIENNKDGGKSYLNKLTPNQQKWLALIANKSESFKAVTTVLATSLTKKIEDPSQDVRYHKIELDNGYSGRSYDTKYITPFFKQKFRRLSMKEAGWLTRSIEQAHPFTLDFPGKIRSNEVKTAFLKLLEDVEENKTNPKKLLSALFVLLLQQTTFKQKKLVQHIQEGAYDISLIIDCLKSHFFAKYGTGGASRLPVIAIYSIYQILLEAVSRYENKKLSPLKSHIAADARDKGVGDIEIKDENNDFFEAVEIKHNIPIDSIVIDDAYEKFKDTPIKRYYLLTTAEPNINTEDNKNVEISIQKIKKEHGCEVIVNGIVPSLKYYLRLLDNPKDFIEKYTNNLKKEFEKSTEVKKAHLIMWNTLVEDYLDE